MAAEIFKGTTRLLFNPRMSSSTNSNGHSRFHFLSKKPGLKAALLEKEDLCKNLKTEILDLKEALTTKERESEAMRLEKEELEARLKMLSKSLKEMESKKIEEGYKSFTSQENFRSAAFALKECEREIESIRLEKEDLKARVEVLSKSLFEKEECDANKEKEIESIRLEKEDLKARVEVLSKSLFEKEEFASNKEKEVETILLEKEELKERFKLLSKSYLEMENTLKESTANKENEVGTILLENEDLKSRVEEGEHLFISHHDKENMPAPCFNTPSPSQGSYLRIPLFPALKLHGQTSQSNRLSEQHFKDNHKYIGNAEDANKIKRKSIFSTSAMPQPQEDAMEKLSCRLENIAPPPSYTGEEIPPLNMSSRITTNAFEHDKNIEDKEDTKKDLFSVEYKSFSSIGMKNTLTSENPNTHSCTGSTNGPAEIYIPKCNNIPSLELPSSRSLESESSSKELCKEAWVAYYFPHLNISPPGTSNVFSELFMYCEECKNVHYTYHYCYYKPCAACYSKEHHFINCPFLDFIPQGAVFNRDVFQVVCGCNSPFDQDEWFCSCCFGKSRVTKLKVKFCFLCLTIGHHNYYECPEDKVAADKHRSSREAKFNSAKARSLLPPTESYSTIKRDGNW